MWKDFFYYTKSERRAIYVLLVLMFVLIVSGIHITIAGRMEMTKYGEIWK